MNIARPAGGFHIVLAPDVEAHAKQLIEEDLDFLWKWKSALMRLAYTAHKEGVQVTSDPRERAAAFVFDGVRIALVWRVLGDTVNVLRGDF